LKSDEIQRDIKSPIAVAQQKQATKLGLPANTTADVLPKIKPSTDTSISPTKAGSSNLQPARSGEEGQTPNGGTFPELPSPGLREADGSRSAGVARTLVDKEGNVTNVTYAVAIYPYVLLIMPSDELSKTGTSLIGKTSSMSPCKRIFSMRRPCHC